MTAEMTTAAEVLGYLTIGLISIVAGTYLEALNDNDIGPVLATLALWPLFWVILLLGCACGFAVDIGKKLRKGW